MIAPQNWILERILLVIVNTAEVNDRSVEYHFHTSLVLSSQNRLHLFYLLFAICLLVLVAHSLTLLRLKVHLHPLTQFAAELIENFINLASNVEKTEAEGEVHNILALLQSKLGSKLSTIEEFHQPSKGSDGILEIYALERCG